MAIKKKILVIDDEKGFAELIKMVLEDTGRYTVIAENNGEAGVEAALNNNPALILLDLMMPGMDGPDVAEKIENNKATKDTPIIFLTAAVTDEETRGEGGDIGGRAFLAKPVKIKELIRCIDEKVS